MSAMTVTGIFTRIQRTFGDEAGVQLTEADVIRWINDAQSEAVNQNDSLLMTETLIDSVAGQAEYTLASTLYTIHHVFYRDSDTSETPYYALRFLPVAEMNDDVPGWQGTDWTGHPTYYTKITDSKLYLWPTPDAAYTGAIKVVHSKYPDEIVSNADPLELPEYLHKYIESYCMMKAYEMDENFDAVAMKARTVQATLDENRYRNQWFGVETYPVVVDYDQ